MSDKLDLLAAAVADYEQEFGEITTEEILAQQRADREDAVVTAGSWPTEALRSAAAGRHDEGRIRPDGV